MTWDQCYKIVLGILSGYVVCMVVAFVLLVAL